MADFKEVVRVWADEVGGGSYPCINVGYSSRLTSGAEKGLPAMY